MHGTSDARGVEAPAGRTLLVYSKAMALRRRLAPLVWSVMTLTLACAEPPTREMNQAQGAIDTARAAGAAEYARDEFAAAETALARSRQAADERDFRQALNHALDARDRAQTAARQAADEKARLRTEADRALRHAEVALEHSRTRLEDASDARVPAKVLASTRAAVTAAQGAFADAQAAFDKGDYIAVLAAVDQLQARVQATTSEIDAAIAARTAARPARRARRP
jgi:hypothetical protein